MRQIQIAGETVEFTSEIVYGTPQEASAFRDGVELVNDSALTVVGILEKDGQYSVFLYDEDAE
jgi:hypothetical protein